MDFLFLTVVPMALRKYCSRSGEPSGGSTGPPKPSMLLYASGIQRSRDKSKSKGPEKYTPKFSRWIKIFEFFDFLVVKIVQLIHRDFEGLSLILSLQELRWLYLNLQQLIADVFYPGPSSGLSTRIKVQERSVRNLKVVK